tara:strand:+ start:71 stop:265 length:195 start_codon:yes stop_codon:yes gene_type:complete
MESKNNREIMLDCLRKIKTIQSDITHIKSDLQIINTYIMKKKQEEEKLKKGENIAQSNGGWFWN